MPKRGKGNTNRTLGVLEQRALLPRSSQSAAWRRKARLVLSLFRHPFHLRRALRRTLKRDEPRRPRDARLHASSTSMAMEDGCSWADRPSASSPPRSHGRQPLDRLSRRAGQKKWSQNLGFMAADIRNWPASASDHDARAGRYSAAGAVSAWPIRRPPDKTARESVSPSGCARSVE